MRLLPAPAEVRAALVAASEDLRERFGVAMGPDRGAALADRLCQACVDLLAVDQAALSLIIDGKPSGTLGASSAKSRSFEDLEFTIGEGPCLDAVAQDSPVLVSDLAGDAERRWAVYSPAVRNRGVRAVYALPVSVANFPAGALALFRTEPGPLAPAELAGGLVAAELAALPLLDLMAADLHAAVTEPTSSAWTELGVLSRIEVNQATGVLIAQLAIKPAEALIRLRAYAFAHDMSASDVARDIIEHRLRLDNDQASPAPGQNGDHT